MRNRRRISHLLLILLLWGSVVVNAAEQKQYLLTERTYKSLNTAQDLMEKSQYASAETKLKDLLEQTKAGSYDRAVVEQTLGYLYASQDQYEAAIQAFQRALDANALPDKVVHNLRYNQAQLLLANEQYQAGVNMMQTWLATEKSPPSSVYVMLSSAYYRLQNYAKVVENMQRVIKLDKTPKEDWYRLLLSAHLELKQYKSAINVLETLITQYPYQKTYWDQLAALYQQQSKEFTSMAVQMLARKLDLGDAKSLVGLADMYRYLNIPYKAAKLLQQGIDAGVIEADFDNLQKLADGWLAAREPEQALPVLAKMTKMDQSGETDLKLGRVYVGLEKWQAAVTALSNSLDKLDGKVAGTATLLLGMAYFHEGKLKLAKSYFTKAVAYKSEREQAGQWLRHVDELITEKANAA